MKGFTLKLAVAIALCCAACAEAGNVSTQLDQDVGNNSNSGGSNNDNNSNANNANNANNGDDASDDASDDVGSGNNANNANNANNNADASNNGTPTDTGDDRDAAQGDSDDVSDVAPDVVEDTFDACVAVTATAAPVTRPVDIIWVIDASPSMDEEIAIIESQLNAFALRIGMSGLDYRVILIGSDHEHCFDGQCFYEICVPEPLSRMAGCPDTDSDRYLHVRADVHSGDALDVTVANYSAYASFLRTDQNALTHFVIVTDDDAGWGVDADEFAAFLTSAVAPGFSTDVSIHSVVELEPYDSGCIFDDTCSCSEEQGATYLDLSARTGGSTHSVCAEDWTPIFETLEQRVIEGTEIPCLVALPDPGEFMAFNPEEVNVAFGEGEARQILGQVDDASSCREGAGWYYDDEDTPTQINLCPSSCGDLAGTLSIELGCRTVKY